MVGVLGGFVAVGYRLQLQYMNTTQPCAALQAGWQPQLDAYAYNTQRLFKMLFETAHIKFLYTCAT